jgi:hypothetical protein
MKRKTSNIPSRIWTFGCFAPTIGADLVERQFSKGRGYKNKLTEIEKARRTHIEDAYRALPEVGPAMLRVDDLTRQKTEAWKRINDAKAAVRSNKIDDSLERALLKKIKEELNGAYEAVRKAKADYRKYVQALGSLDPEVGPLIAELQSMKDKEKTPETEARAKVLRVAIREGKAAKPILQTPEELADVVAKEKLLAARAAVSADALHWGTYLLIEEAAEQASKTPTGPQFRRWDGAGRIGISFQKSMTMEGRLPINGAPIADLFSGLDTRMRISPVKETAWVDNSSPSRRQRRTSFQIRIGSNGRAPVWAEFPMILHRALPSDGVVKRAWVKRTPIASKFRYELQLVIESASFAKAKKPGNRTAAIDVGWRLKDDAGLRVAMITDDQGASEEFVLPSIFREGYQKTFELQSQRDKNFDLARESLRVWLEGAQNAPEWLRKACEHVDRWKSPGRLSELLAGVPTYRCATEEIPAWRHARFEGDEVIYEALEAWRRQDKHLHEWQANQRDKILNRRKNFYRNKAANLVRVYNRIILENFDLRDVAERPEPGDENVGMHDTARRHRFQVSVSEFRLCLLSAASREGVEIVEVDAKMTTRQCHQCFNIAVWDQAAELVHRCSQCGLVWDQDVNAGKNMLARAGK